MFLLPKIKRNYQVPCALSGLEYNEEVSAVVIWELIAILKSYRILL